MHAMMLQNDAFLLRRRDDSSGGGSFGCLVLLVLVGLVAYFLLRGRRDRREELGTAKRAMGSAPLEGQAFACPYPKCPTCGAAADKMKHDWDGMRKISWSCGYCGSVAGVQELKDEELPASARQRLGLDAPPQTMVPGQAGPSGFGGGGLLTGMMIGSMLGGHSHDEGDHHHHDDDDWGGGSGGSDSGGDWGDSGGDSGGDWGDSGGGDFGGGDSGGSDW